MQSSDKASASIVGWSLSTQPGVIHPLLQTLAECPKNGAQAHLCFHWDVFPLSPFAPRSRQTFRLQMQLRQWLNPHGPARRSQTWNLNPSEVTSDRGLLIRAHAEVRMSSFIMVCFPLSPFSHSFLSCLIPSCLPVSLFWHFKRTLVLKRRLWHNVCGNGDGAELPSHPLSKQAAHRKRCITDRKPERGRATVSLALCHLPGHELFNGFSILVCADMICTIRLWLEPHGAANRWSGCSCANITLIHPSSSSSSSSASSQSQQASPYATSLAQKTIYMLVFHYINLVAPPLDMESLSPLTCSSLSPQLPNAFVPVCCPSAHVGPLNRHLSEHWKDGKTAPKLHKGRIAGA